MLIARRSLGARASMAWLALLLAACGPVGGSDTPTTTPALVVEGPEVYARVCAECHGDQGQGYAGHPGAPPLNDTGHAWHHPDQQIHDWIVNGKLAVVGEGMPALGDRLTDQEVEAVIAYLHSLWTEEQLEIQQDVSERYPTRSAPSGGP